jgi:circadian clock protein KaiC
MPERTNVTRLRRISSRRREDRALPKSLSGIRGLDEITQGGLPRGRPTLICGSAGCGKTLLALEFLIRGAMEFGEPGVFMAFEETPEDLSQNVRSLGFDLDQLIRQKKILVDDVELDPGQIEETGEYDLEGLFIRLGDAIDSVGAKRVVLDTLEVLFGGLSNEAILRSELRRLFRWLKDRGVTAVVTGERGSGTLTRHGMEEYVSDCVILLDHRVHDQVSTRRLRIVKYRGSVHGTNEYPFLIDEDGISVLPITSANLQHDVSEERVSTGIARLDAMLGGQGYYRGTTVLISGTAGTGKTSIACSFADAACARGERCLYLSFEESEKQIVRNMRSIGLDLQRWIDRGLLRIHATRPSLYGLEMHLAKIHKVIEQFGPRLVVVDPISNFTSESTTRESHAMVTRLVDFLKTRQITSVMTNLSNTTAQSVTQTEIGISSIVDMWLLLRDIETNGERNRGMYVLKARGIAHSNQVREFLLTPRGIELQDVYVGPGGVLTGSSRLAQEARDEAEALARSEEIERRQAELDRRRRALDQRIAGLKAEFDSEAQMLERDIARERARVRQLAADRADMSRSRGADSDPPDGKAAAREKQR